MKYDIIWSSKALRDLDEIYNYYVEKSKYVAVTIYNGILDEVSLLNRHPFIAAAEQTLVNCTKLYRSLVVSKGRYKVVYSVEKGCIYIARIWSCRRDPKTFES